MSKSIVPKVWKSAKLPTKLGDCIDLAFGVRAKRKALQAEVDAMEKEERKIKDHIIMTFKKADLEGARGKRGSITIQEKDVPQIDPDSGGWEAVYNYIIKNKAFDLLQKRFGEAACQARWEQGEVIPGVKTFHKVDVSLSEAK